MSSSEPPHPDRRAITFEQAEGAEPLPAQLKLRELSPLLRSTLWALIYQAMTESSVGSDQQRLVEPWLRVLRVKHVLRDHRPADEFTAVLEGHIKQIKNLIFHGDYIRVLGFVEFAIRQLRKEVEFGRTVQAALVLSKAAYRVVGGDTIVPVPSIEDGLAVERAFVDLSETEFNGARTHLRNAGAELTAGRYADSVRESIHAVASIAHYLEPTATRLEEALARLEKSASIHGALKAGICKIYGYTSDAQGIRHPLLDASVAKVDESDALFMFGSCAAFVSYLIGKARSAGLIKA